MEGHSGYGKQSNNAEDNEARERDEEITNYIRHYMAHSEPFCIATSFKKFCIIKHSEWYETYRCYHCKEPWESSHRCKGKGKVHYIQVLLDDEDSGEEETLSIQEGKLFRGKPLHLETTMEEPLMTILHEEHTELQVCGESLDIKSCDHALVSQYVDFESLLLEEPLKAQGLAMEELAEHLPCGPVSVACMHPWIGWTENLSAGLSQGLESSLALAEIFDLNGNMAHLTDLWKDRKAVVGFARHFGCVLCRKRADILASQKSQMDAAGVALVLIGPGNIEQAKTFAEQTKFPGEIYADPNHTSFNALKFVSGVSTTFTPTAAMKIIELYAEGYRQDWGLSFEKDTVNRGGWQQGGILVAGPGRDNILYLHKDKEAGDDPNIEDVMKACCI